MLWFIGIILHVFTPFAMTFTLKCHSLITPFSWNSFLYGTPPMTFYNNSFARTMRKMNLVKSYYLLRSHYYPKGKGHRLFTLLSENTFSSNYFAAIFTGGLRCKHHTDCRYEFFIYLFRILLFFASMVHSWRGFIVTSATGKCKSYDAQLLES